MLLIFGLYLQLYFLKIALKPLISTAGEAQTGGGGGGGGAQVAQGGQQGEQQGGQQGAMADPQADDVSRAGDPAHAGAIIISAALSALIVIYIM